MRVGVRIVRVVGFTITHSHHPNITHSISHHHLTPVPVPPSFQLTTASPLTTTSCCLFTPSLFCRAKPPSTYLQHTAVSLISGTATTPPISRLFDVQFMNKLSSSNQEKLNCCCLPALRVHCIQY
ncbi:hypothetical protein QVD17_20884 [Tagetes erecta]|uniref:Uncharacterized protein n=1 Tax=Tagetes erecta TaxID=13708 RepID=A0AAD8KQR9_TARER|nr:hypothetical protein QVD17_20884 [Tagetes erecta]